ncbi:MAG: nuclear transport factor 2 family protein [Caulobacterales bacterium]
MNLAEKLWAIEEIKKVKAKYYRLMDSKKFEEMDAIFTKEAILDVRQSTDITADLSTPMSESTPNYMIGRDAILHVMRTVGGVMLSMHHGHMPEIELESDTRATGIWAMEDLVEWPGGGGYAGMLHGFGWYYDTYLFEEGRWRIHHSQLRRIRVDTK